MNRQVVVGFVVACSAAALACDTPGRVSAGTGSPVSSTPVTVSTPAGPLYAQFSVSGTVYGFEPGQPLPVPLTNVGLDITVEYQSWPPNTASDLLGRYSRKATGQADVAQKVRAEAAGFSQPCGALFPSSGVSAMDIYLVYNSILSTSGIPANFPIADPRITGRTVERLPDGSLQPIPGVTIVADFTGAMGWSPSANTMSDATGSYLICGAKSLLGIQLYASKDGYRNVDFYAGNKGGQFDIVMTK